MQLTNFKVTNYRNILDSGWIEISDIAAFVGQNEAGKSNLFEALYRINPFVPGEAYNIDEDWPVDDWSNKTPSAQVCEAKFALTPQEIKSLYDAAAPPVQKRPQAGEPPADKNAKADKSAEEEDEAVVALPSELTVIGARSYTAGPTFAVAGDLAEKFDAAKVDAWAKANAPKFVLIQDYGLSGTQIELDQLADRCKKVEWHELTNEEQTIKIVLDLAALVSGSLNHDSLKAQFT